MRDVEKLRNECVSVCVKIIKVQSCYIVVRTRTHMPSLEARYYKWEEEKEGEDAEEEEERDTKRNVLSACSKTRWFSKGRPREYCMNVYNTMGGYAGLRRASPAGQRSTLPPPALPGFSRQRPTLYILAVSFYSISLFHFCLFSTFKNIFLILSFFLSSLHLYNGWWWWWWWFVLL